jgi:TPP-dependent pyruvate/acetoin dehydrogenase alpha subunit
VTAALREADAALASSGAFHVPVGGVAPIVEGALSGLERGDWWVPGLRERAGGALRGAPTERLHDPSAGARPYKIAPASPSPALRALYAVGLALGSDRCALAHLGIGSVSDGAFTEALNLGALHRARVILLVAVHPLDGDAPLGPQTAASPAALARAYG